MRKLTHKEIIHRQQERQPPSRLPFCVVLNNIRSLYNVGSIFRTCDGIGVEKIWICGITGHPPHNQISKTALGAEDTVPWEYSPDIYQVIRQLKMQGYQIVLLEQTDESISYHQFVPKPPVCLVVGNEIDGVSGKLAEMSDIAVEIGMDGLKNSLNVAVALGIVGYHIRHRINQQ